MFSMGDWRWLNDVEDAKLYDENQVERGTYDLYIKDLKVGDAAQMSAALGINYELFKGMKMGVDYIYYDNLYAQYDPLSRDDITDRDQSWQLPAYGLVDLSLSYRFKISDLDATFYANINNLFDTEYFSEGDDGSDHGWQSADVYYGLGRTWMMGVKSDSRFTKSNI